MAAMVMRGIAASASNAARNWRPMAIASAGPANSVMSAPAAKILSPPHTTTAPGGSSINPTVAASSWHRTATDKALAFGRSSLMIATPSSRRPTLTNSSDMAGTLQPELSEQLVGRPVRVDVTGDDRVPDPLVGPPPFEPAHL